jgi:hypothetical protein
MHCSIYRSPAVLLALLVAAPMAWAEVSFNKDIRPIMSDTCFRCHGPDKSSRMAGLRLDIREEALKKTKSGAAPIVPGDPEQSAVIARVFATNTAKIMPPAFAHKELTQAQKETIRQWVAEGAKYEGHWAYAKVTRPVPPAVGPNPIDSFIRARLIREDLTPSPEADKRTLIRRVTLDLTGLPPTPEDVAAFLNDSSADAYPKIVDRLLASPGFAEKQTMLWLDSVRYADTCGFHGDNPIPTWPYRDYVLRSFRDNKPFDVFTREQLAGDLLPGGGTEQKIASAYNRLIRTSAEGGIQPLEYLAKYGADRVRTTSAVWLGSTMGCAECHDHKFDPFTSKDFYAMKAFFSDIQETGFMQDRGPAAWGTKLALPTPEQKQAMEDLTSKLEAAQKNLDRKIETFSDAQFAWERRVLADYEAGRMNWKFQTPLTARSVAGVTLKIYNQEPVESTYDYRGSLNTERHPGLGLVVASGANPDNDTYTVTFKPGAGTWTAFGLEVPQDDTLPGARVARGSDRLAISEADVEVSGVGRIPLTLANSSINDKSLETPAMAAIDGDPKTAWGMFTYGEGRNIFLALRFGKAVTTDAASIFTVRLHHDSEYRRATLGRFRLALSSVEYSWPGRDTVGPRPPDSPNHGVPSDVLKALRIPVADRNCEQDKAVEKYFQWSSAEYQPLVVEVASLQAKIDLLDAAIPRVLVTESTDPRETRVLARGNFMDESGEIVEPAIPRFLGTVDTGGGRATRLDLANWLVSSENPLTARVFVNRMWRQFFGIGLSKALDDLGSQGEWPVNPELLDWLAAEFMQPQYQAAGAHLWDVKHLLRTIVTSQTYRQTSTSTPQIDAKDPTNRLLARQERFRVDAESVHDVALSISGLLAERFGGPSVRPPEPDGYLAALNYPKREYPTSRGDDQHRRGLYTFWQRSFLHPSLATFDAPSREECTVNRTNSNTPLQALVLLNDPIYLEAARVFAQNILQQGGPTVGRRIDWAFQRALGRTPAPDERKILSDLYQQSLSRFRAAPADAKRFVHVGESPVPPLPSADLAAMTTVARAILNLHETITRN